MKRLRFSAATSHTALCSISLILAGFLKPLSCCADSASLSGDWPTYGNGQAHSGYFPGTVNGLPFVYKWKAPMPNSHINQAAIGGGRVFVTTGWYYGAMSLIALDAGTGQPLWTNYLGNPYAINPPTYDQGSVYVQQSDDFSPRVFSFDAATGATNWSTSYRAQAHAYMAPIVAGGTLFTGTGLYVDLAGYNQASGALQFDVPLIGNGCSQWTPAYHGGEVYTWVNGFFSEHNPFTGSRNWTLTNATQNEFLYSMDRTLAVAGGRAYFTSTSKLMAVDLTLRQNLWSIDGPFSGTPAVANGRVYAISNGVVAAYTTDGASLSTFRGTNGSSFSGELIVTDDAFMVAGSYGVYVFKLSDASVQQYISSSRPYPPYAYYSSTISLANNTLYIASGDGNLYAHSAENLLKFTIDSTGGAYGSPSPDPYGANYVLANSTVTNTVTSPFAGLTGIRYVVTGWTGTGSVPPVGTGNAVRFLATNDSSLRWNWQTQYWLNASTVSSGWLNVTNDWFDAGTILSITATPSNYYHFVGWSNDLSGTSQTAQLVMNGPRQVTATFDANLVTNNVPQWWLAYYGIPTTDAGALADNDGDGFANWKEYRAGTDPTNAASALRLTMRRSYDQLILGWPSLYGQRYRLLFSTNLNDGFSIPFATNIYAYSSFTEYWFWPSTNQAFFRLQIE
ncbi:MAG TPA: PQQ-binding-like beta-propeller repeat protein [Verrucomicrobiae bacterium]